jgi:phage major head subunit gpT-like protein
MSYYHVTHPSGTLTFFGGPLRSAGPLHVWLTAPDGRPLLRVPAHMVVPVTLEQEAQRIVEERRASKAPWN